MTHPFSSKSYSEITESGYVSKRQAMVLSLFIDYGALSGERVVQLLLRNFNIRRGTSDATLTRISELKKMGFLEEVGSVVAQSRKTQVVCKWTGATTPTYPPTVAAFNLEQAKVELQEHLKGADISENFERFLLRLLQRTKL